MTHLTRPSARHRAVRQRLQRSHGRFSSGARRRPHRLAARAAPRLNCCHRCRGTAGRRSRCGRSAACRSPSRRAATTRDCMAEPRIPASSSARKTPTGFEVETLDDETFLAINGVQTLSHTYCNLIREAGDLSQLGVAALRLSPHTCDMVAVARHFSRRSRRPVRARRCHGAPSRALSRCGVFQRLRSRHRRRALRVNP